MKFLELAKKRRSFRHYSPEPVTRETVERCLDAARLAPSACNSQPWRFIVVDEPGQRQRLANAAFSGIYSMNRFAGEAPVLIAIITERSKLAAKLGGHFRGVKYSLIDVGIACEHLILQAAEEGLGSCWLGWFSEKRVKKALGLPRGTKIDVMICLGRPAEGISDREPVRKSMDEIRRYTS